MLSKKLRYLALPILVVLLGFSNIAFSGDKAVVDDDFREHLREVEILMSQVDENAAHLQALLNRSFATWQAHSFELKRIQGELNEAGKLVPKLQKHSNEEKWLEQAVDRVVAKLKAMTTSAERAIEFANTNKSIVDLQNSRYETKIAVLADFSKDIDETIDYIQKRWDLEYEEMTS